MCHRPEPNLVEQVLPDSLEPNAKSDKTAGLTRRDPLGIDRADTYTDLYNLQG